MSSKSRPDEDIDLFDYENPEFMAALRHYLGVKRWSWNRLCREVGVAFSTVLLWRRNETRPTLDNVQALCRVFGVSQGEFFTKGEELTDAHRERIRGEQRERERRLLESMRTVEDFLEAACRLEPASREELAERLREFQAVAARIVRGDLEAEGETG